MKRFVHTVWQFYTEHGRALPWRTTHTPYKILVSELMLQQTQVERVIPKYKAFLKAFPNVRTLASAPLSSVLLLWQGLGYNRRAKFLHSAARVVVERNNGVFPNTVEALEALPGVGPYTARAVAVFAYNTPEVFIETNIRTVFTHSFFKDREKVSDVELMPYIEKALRGAMKQGIEPREWYAALMDYGSFLKRSGVRLNAKSAQYTKQSIFKGSARELRGRLVRALLEKSQTVTELVVVTQHTKARVAHELEKLCKEGLVHKKGMRFFAGARV